MEECQVPGEVREGKFIPSRIADGYTKRKYMLAIKSVISAGKRA